MLRVVAGTIRWRSLRIDASARLPEPLGGAAGALNPLFERTHGGQILVNANAVLYTDLPTQAIGVAENPVEQQRVHLDGVIPRTRRRPEKPLKCRARIDLPG